MDSLAGILTRRYGLVAPALERVPRGHTNETHFVGDGERRLVLRRSWPGKSDEQVTREQTVLAGLAGSTGLRVPRVIATVDGAAHTVEPTAAGSRTLHLFERLTGAPPEPRSGPLPVARARAALAHLCLLHRALARIPGGNAADPIAWLRERRDRIVARQSIGLPPDIAAELPRLWRTVEEVFAQVTTIAAGPAQWLHGDVHAGNLLFEGDRVTGVVDFDEVGRGAPSLEVALALFAVSRDDRVDARFRYDRARWLEAASAYDGPRPAALPVYERLFCVDQVLIHLEASQRGLWSLVPGIGFHPCWRTLVSGSEP